MKICILTIATNKYIQFVERLYDNIDENFLNGHSGLYALYISMKKKEIDVVVCCNQRLAIIFDEK